MTRERTQAQQILEHMENVGPITPLDALRLFGCFRLSARIKDLRDKGHIINTVHKTVTNADGSKSVVGEYHLIRKAEV